MGYPTKIVTCCYCGARAALVLPKGGRHELTCSQCAAPLHELKMLPVQKDPVQRSSVKPASKTVEKELIRPSPYRAAKAEEYRSSMKRSKKRKKPKRSFKFFKEILEEAADFIEDIFD